MTRTQDHATANTRLRPASRPPRWKQTLLTFVAIFPMLVVIQEVWGKQLAPLPLPVRTLIIVAIVAPLANYLVFPLLTRLMGRFLRP